MTFSFSAVVEAGVIASTINRWCFCWYFRWCRDIDILRRGGNSGRGAAQNLVYTAKINAHLRPRFIIQQGQVNQFQTHHRIPAGCIWNNIIAGAGCGAIRENDARIINFSSWSR